MALNSLFHADVPLRN